MKKILVLILSVLVALCVFASCNDGESEVQTEKPDHIPDVESTEGLEFQLNDDMKSYKVVGMGTCTASEIVIDGHKGLPVTSIKFSGDSNYENVTSIVLGDSVIYLNDGFTCFPNLKSVKIGDGVKSIEGDFWKCRNLTDVTIGSGVKHIDSYEFYYCDNLENVYYDGDIASWCDIEVGSNLLNGGAKFYFKNASGEYDLLTDLVIPDTVTEIKAYVFSGCTSIKSLVIPDSVAVSIGRSAFYRCINLESVSIGNSATIIEDSAFSECRKLKSVTIGNGVTSIGSRCFGDCEALEEITLGNSVKTLGDRFLYGSRISFLEIPDSVTSLDLSSIDGCANFYSLTLGSGLESVSGKVSGTYKLVEVINKSSVEVDPKCFGDDVEVHNGESKIVNNGDYLFYTRDGKNFLVGYIGDEISFVLPQNYNGESYQIFKDAFNSNINIISVTVPAGVTGIDSSAFAGCNRLVEVINHSNLSIEKGEDGDKNGGIALYALAVHSEESKVVNVNGYLFYSVDGCKYLLGYVGNETDLVLPENYEGEAYEIYEYAFYRNRNIKSVVIPDGVESIGYHAFRYCAALTSVTIGNGVESIGDYAFSGTAYYNNKSNWENDVLYIGKYLIDAENDILGDYSVKEGTKIIAPRAFFGFRLTSIDIPDSVTSIGDRAFESSDLTSVTIGNGVESIGDYAFAGCDRLTSMKFRGTEAEWNAIEKGSSWRYNVPEECQIIFNYTGE